VNPKLLPNRALENYKEEDAFNFLIKAEAMRIFLEQNSTSLDKNKMLVLYGDWGSGKTSLLRHIEQKINKDVYKTIFFQAWEHEKDDNLALSLCDALLDEVDRNNPIIKDFMKGALIAFKSFASGVTLKAPGFLSGLGVDFEFSGEKYVKAIDEVLKDTTNPSFYVSNKKFKESFQKAEDVILKLSGAQSLLIIIDDLDRCEPENVLNLITALKLFFTYGRKSVFICGIDKEAVTKAVKTKYLDVIKSEEYLEKVFDVSFNMPKSIPLHALLLPHFAAQTELENRDLADMQIVEDFFNSIRFTNPRRLKKILNKYEILKSFRNLETIPNYVRELIPNILSEHNYGSLFETIVSLFIIILYEFYIDEFKDLENYEQKNLNYIEIQYESAASKNSAYTKSRAKSDVNNMFYLENIKSLSLGNIVIEQAQSGLSGNPRSWTKIVTIFSHNKPKTLSQIHDKSLNEYDSHFTDDRITTNFCRFLITNMDIFEEEVKKSQYIIWNVFEMVKYLL